jgi:hypothetical protein
VGGGMVVVVVVVVGWIELNVSTGRSVCKKIFAQLIYLDEEKNIYIYILLLYRIDHSYHCGGSYIPVSAVILFFIVLRFFSLLRQ